MAKKTYYDKLVADSSLPSAYIDTGRFVGLNEILKRFHLGNDEYSESHNAVFTRGFEDPTRLTFKVEFGDWGASVLSQEMLEILFNTSKFSNVGLEDYDLFPMGLLHPDFSRNNDDTNAWNSQTAYNTYNYLMNVNEDARALFIKLFVLGLYTILRDMPYIFKSISGLEKLQSMDPGKGVRLKDAKITLTCIEGIDMKIRTLLQLYRKAAYDDVWQRWVLPDIYRYFKMIIYVFDRRILHTSSGTYNINQDSFPIYALECGPCEFDIESIFENEYSTAYSEHKDAETKITITVKNVKTYYSNMLFNKVEGLAMKVNWISDFDSISERATFNSVDTSTYSNFRMRWLQRMFMLPSEYKAYYDNMVEHKVTNNDNYNMARLNSQYIEQPNNTWHLATVRDDVYVIRSWKDLKRELVKALFTKLTIVRDSRFDDNRNMFYNDLVRPNEYSYYYDYRPRMQGIDSYRPTMQMRRYVMRMIRHMLNNFRITGSDAYYNIVDPGMVDTSLPEMTPNIYVNTSTYIKDLEYVELDMNLDKPEQNYVEPIIDLHKNDLTYTELQMNLDKPEQEYTGLEMNLDKPEHPYVEPILDLHKNKMDYVEPIIDLHKNNHPYVEPIIDVHKNKLDYVEPILDLHKNEQTYVEPILDLHKNEHPYVEPILDLHKNELTYVEPIIDLHKNNHPYVEPVIDVHKNPLVLIDIIEDLHKNKHPMNPLIINDNKPDMTYVQIIDSSLDVSIPFVDISANVELNHSPFVSYEPNLEKPNMTYIPINTESIQLVHAPMVDIINYDSSFKMINVSIYSNMELPEYNMAYIQQDTSVIRNIKDGNIIQNVDKEHHNFTEIINSNEHQEHSQFVYIVNSSNDVSMNMTNIHVDDYKFDTLLTPIKSNIDIPEMDMVHVVANTSKPEQDLIYVHDTSYEYITDMTTVNLDVSLPEMDMTTVSLNTSLPEMDMTELYMNTSLPEMDMVNMNTSTVIPDMQYTELYMNTSLPEMDMTELSINTSIADIPMQSIQVTDSSIDMVMTKISINDSKVHIPMLHIEIRDKAGDVPMIRPNDNESTEIPTDALISTIVNTEDDSKLSMHMVSLNDSPKLVQKIQALTSIDTDELKTISDLQLVSLADIIEQTYNEIRERSKHMVLLENKPEIHKKKTMKMQSIELPPRNTMFVNKIKDIDDAALERAYQAKLNYNNNKSSGSRGAAM